MNNGAIREPRDHARLSCIPFKYFQHSSALRFPSEPRNIFSEYREVSYYYEGKLHDRICDSIRLRTPANKLANKQSRNNKDDFLGSDLYRGWENFEPLSPGILDSPEGCYKWIEKWEHDNKEDYSSQYGSYVIISPRHYLVEIAMQLFQTSKYCILCTYLGNGKIVFSREKQAQEKNSCSNFEIGKKILNSGYVLEDTLTEGPRIKNDPFFAIIEAKLDKQISLVLRCELDSYNEITDMFTELKCYAPLNIRNLKHREKLLKTWIQIAMLPRCDLLIGIRDTQMGQLQDLQYFTKDELYHKINNRGLPKLPEKLNFNVDMAIQWFQHCIKSICRLIGDNLDRPSPQCFKLTIDNLHNIQLKKLKRIPAHVELPDN